MAQLRDDHEKGERDLPTTPSEREPEAHRSDVVQALSSSDSVSHFAILFRDHPRDSIARAYSVTERGP